ncbi:MAG: DUF5916 domain-containing protein [Cyclobacteriaceae bacterium]
MKNAFIFTIALLGSHLSIAQEDNGILYAKFIEEAITLDGALDEAFWEDAGHATNFWQYFPTDSVRAGKMTQVKIVYDDENIYVGVYAESEGNKYVASSLRRDFSGRNNDNVSVMFDTFSDGANAFLFGITPYGVQREVMISEGGTISGFNRSWDQKWRSAAQNFEDHYTAEMVIPLTSIKFPEGSQQWRFQTYRFDFQSQEQSAWARVPQNQILASLAFMGIIEFEKPLGESRTPLALIPYVNTLAYKDAINSEQDVQLKVGGDAKVAIGNGMNLDITLNPDFSTVEVDDIFTNLTRFEVRLPERRQFFIDNSDLFGSFGDYFGSSRSFFSRRIGLARDTANNLIQNDIIGGVRLSGKVNDDLRVGFLNLQTAADKPNEIVSNNNMMMALQRKVFARSNVGVFMINRQASGTYDFLDPDEQFNRVVGADYNLASRDNVWTGKAYVHKSFNPNDSKGNLSYQTALEYNTRNWNLAADFFNVDHDFQSDLGFVPRKDIARFGFNTVRNFYPNSKIFNRFSVAYLRVNWLRPTLDYKKSDELNTLTFTSNFKDQSSLELVLEHNYTYLTADFNPTGLGEAGIPGAQGYDYNQVSMSYISNFANVFTYEFSSRMGSYYNGNAYSNGATVGYRFQPWASLSVNAQYDRILFPNQVRSADFWLITSRAEVTFSNSLFWTTIVQYSNQRDNLGINSRLQWRYAPLSDLFIVYNDNYIPGSFGPKFRSINLKLSYWFNP